MVVVDEVEEKILIALNFLSLILHNEMCFEIRHKKKNPINMAFSFIYTMWDIFVDFVPPLAAKSLTKKCVDAGDIIEKA